MSKITSSDAALLRKAIDAAFDAKNCESCGKPMVNGGVGKAGLQTWICRNHECKEYDRQKMYRRDSAKDEDFKCPRCDQKFTAAEVEEGKLRKHIAEHRGKDSAPTKVFRKFRDVAVGEKFEFARPPGSGMMTGPWEKKGSRTYLREGDPKTKYTVGSINAQVEPKPGWAGDAAFTKSFAKGMKKVTRDAGAVGFKQAQQKAIKALERYDAVRGASDSPGSDSKVKDAHKAYKAAVADLRRVMRSRKAS